MKLILAQLKKDIQCQRVPLILWGICLAAGGIPLVLLAVFTRAHSFDMANANEAMGVLSVGALALMGMLAAGFGMFLLVPVMVIRIVHEDPLMGTTAFWRTRPIPRGKLLAAKALFIAILPLPLLLVGGKNSTFGAGHFWPDEFAWIAAVAALSAITPGVREFLGYGVAFLFGKSIFTGIVERLWNRFQSDGPIVPHFPHGAISELSAATQGFHFNAQDIFHLCYFAGFSAVFIHQYLTLQTRRSLVLFIATIVAVSLLQVFTGQPVFLCLLWQRRDLIMLAKSP